MVTTATLHGVRLGHVRRTILLNAERGIIISDGARDNSTRHSRWRAARDLERLGLIRLERMLR